MKKAFLVVFVAILLEQTPVQADSSGSMFYCLVANQLCSLVDMQLAEYVAISGLC